MEHPGVFRRSLPDLLNCGLCIAIVLMAILPGLMTGWFPQDEGQIGQAAARVLSGELPHRDFDDMYTGGLSFLHAAVFRMLGVRSESLRWGLLAAFLPFVVCVYWISRRFWNPPAASLITVFSGLFSVPLNPESMPSWYNLFLTTWATAFLLRFIEQNSGRWLFLAGLMAGFSLLMKLTGVFSVAAGVLFLVHWEQLESRTRAGWSAAFPVFSMLCLSIFGILGLTFISAGDRLMTTLHLTLPVAALAACCAWHELASGRGPSGLRMRKLISLQSVFLAGVFCPLLIFVGYYWQQDGLAELREGLFVLPGRRLERATFTFPGLSEFLIAAVPATLLFPELRRRLFPDRIPGALLLILATVLMSLWFTERGARLTFQAFRNFTPFVCAASLAVLHRAQNPPLDPASQSRLWLLCVAMVMGSLVQFPFAIDFYFLYTAPLTVLCLAALLAVQPSASIRTFGSLAVFYGVFSVVILRTVVPLGSVTGVPADLTTESLSLPRCSLVIESSTARSYRRLIQEIQARTQPGEAILAAPDSPEVYFLSDRPNPTRIFYDFFRPEFQTDTQALDRLLDQHRIRLVVLKQPQELDFSSYSQVFEDHIRRRFPTVREIECTDYRGSPADARFVVYTKE